MPNVTVPAFIIKMELSFHSTMTGSCPSKYVGYFLFPPFHKSEAPNSNAHRDQQFIYMSEAAGVGQV